MNKQRKVLITTTYNEMGIIIDTKAEEFTQPERQKGRWTRHFDGSEWSWYCSACKEQWYEEDLWMGGNDFPNFCPNCGADMRGGKEDR